jgi:hypothetical protein
MSRAGDITYIFLPFILWILTFVVLREYFLILMMVSTSILGFLTLLFYREKVFWGDAKKNIIIGASMAISLYFVFVVGDVATAVIGLHAYVEDVYSMINTVSNTAGLVFGLVWIGVMEEIYWRGGLQGLFAGKYGGYQWLVSTVPYTLVHVATLNPILVLAAFIVGLAMGWTAYRYGIITSSIAHVIWILLVVVIAPPTFLSF